MHRNPAWSLDINSIHQFCSLVDHTKLQTHTDTHMLTLGASLCLAKFLETRHCCKEVINSLLFSCVCLHSSSRAFFLSLLYVLFLPISDFIHRFISDLMSFLNFFPSVCIFLFSSYLYPSFHLSLHYHFLVLSSLQFVLSQVPRLQWSIRVTVMQRAVQSLDQPPSVPRASTQGESMLHRYTGNKF